MPERDLRLYLEDMLDSGNAIAQFVEGLSYEEFRDDRKTYSAVIREFEIIGEAVGKDIASQSLAIDHGRCRNFDRRFGELKSGWKA
jgi:uncharacterized protein with HEPN domain